MAADGIAFRRQVNQKNAEPAAVNAEPVRVQPNKGEQMTFIQFLIDTPVVAFMLLLALLLSVVPAATLLFRKKPGQSDVVNTPVKKPPTTRFLGTQMDIAILIFGLLMLLAVIGWVKKTFFG